MNKHWSSRFGDFNLSFIPEFPQDRDLINVSCQDNNNRIIVIKSKVVLGSYRFIKIVLTRRRKCIDSKNSGVSKKNNLIVMWCNDSSQSRIFAHFWYVYILVIIRPLMTITFHPNVKSSSIQIIQTQGHMAASRRGVPSTAFRLYLYKMVLVSILNKKNTNLIRQAYNF